MLARLILVKHARPIVEPAVAPSDWRLSDEGREAAKGLAPELSKYDPFMVVASVEPKAWETAAILAQRLRVPCAAVAGLHEHERRVEEFGRDSAEFEARVRALFDRPDEVVFGVESADQARDRFLAAVQDALDWWAPQAEGEREQALIVVAHGTVITLLCQAWCSVEPYPLWESLALPSYVVLSLPDKRLLEISS